MISGIGIDIVEITKIKSTIKKWGNSFLKKVFTPQEIQYCKSMKFPYIHFAGRFAAKEATVKAFGIGFWRKGIRWTDLEIIKSDDGSVKVQVLNKLKKKVIGKEILISISHCKNYAVANAAITTKRGQATFLKG